MDAVKNIANVSREEKSVANLANAEVVKINLEFQYKIIIAYS